MVPTLKAEFKKLLTVRSTYLVSLVVVALTILFTYIGTAAIYVDSSTNQPLASQSSKNSSNLNPPVPKANTVPKLSKDLPKDELTTNLRGGLPPVSLFIAVVVILLMAHEFRYNTISYTLTASNSRTRVLLSKMLVGVSFTVFITVLVSAVNIATTYAAVHFKGLHMPPQDISWLYVSGRILVYMAGFSMLALAFITILRNLTAALVTLFVLPTIEAIVGSILSNHNIATAKFLPFSALDRVGDISNASLPSAQGAVSVPQAAMTFVIYLVAIWAVAWYLFLKRDAN